MEFGIISLIPVAVVIIVALITKKAAESLFVGTIVAAVILAIGLGGRWYTDWWTNWFDTVQAVIGGSAYFIIMFGMFGAMIRLLDHSGAALGFADIAARLANSKKKTLLVTFALGVIIFIEDYLNALGVGVAMKTISDKHRISREFLAFVVNSTGAAICILVPVSSWGAVYSGNLDATGMFESGFSAYAKSIPFMLYSWIALIFVLLFIFGIIPVFGAMKKAQVRAESENKPFPEWYYEESADAEQGSYTKSGWWNFVVPMLALIAVAIPTLDITLAVIVSIVVAGIMLIIQKRLTIWAFCESVVDGFKDMAYVTILVLLAFVLQEFNDQLGLTQYVIDSVAPILSPKLFPVIAFIVVAVIAFCTGSFWGVAAISFPIILPIAAEMGVNIYLAIGAVASATAFGSHACFYSDAVTVTAAATGIKNIDYARTALPLIALPFGLSIIAFLVTGFVMGA
jgi:Na+/H+ antiporter NhaC